MQYKKDKEEKKYTRHIGSFVATYCIQLLINKSSSTNVAKYTRVFFGLVTTPD